MLLIISNHIFLDWYNLLLASWISPIVYIKKVDLSFRTGVIMIIDYVKLYE